MHGAKGKAAPSEPTARAPVTRSRRGEPALRCGLSARGRRSTQAIRAHCRVEAKGESRGMTVFIVKRVTAEPGRLPCSSPAARRRVTPPPGTCRLPLPSAQGGRWRRRGRFSSPSESRARASAGSADGGVDISVIAGRLARTRLLPRSPDLGTLARPAQPRKQDGRRIQRLPSSSPKVRMSARSAVRLRRRPSFAAVAGAAEVLAGSPIRGDLQARRTTPATPVSSCCFSRLGKLCPTTTADSATVGRVCESYDRGCRRKREKSLLAASLWMLAAEPDVDPARVPKATGAPIRHHRRRDRD